MGEALIDLVYQYLGLWHKSDTLYKDQNYKDVKWMELANILATPSKYALMITYIYLLMIFLQYYVQ